MHHPIDDYDPDDALAEAAEYLKNASRVAALTGAGISVESGLSTFRGPGGLWEGHAVQDVATPHAFQRDPRLVWRFYNARRDGLSKAQPNPGHRALAQLEEKLGPDSFCLITQNVDGLHRLAGSQHLLELHGSLLRVRCTVCPLVEDRGIEPLDELPKCRDCGELARPDIVWFGEMLPGLVWEKAEAFTQRCDCFLVVGTSANVYPAAGLIHVARGHAARVIEINPDQTEASHLADVCLKAPSGQILPKLMSLLA